MNADDATTAGTPVDLDGPFSTKIILVHDGALSLMEDGALLLGGAIDLLAELEFDSKERAYLAGVLPTLRLAKALYAQAVNLTMKEATR